MKAGFVAAATVAAVALLPASAGATVVTPDVVTPQVVTPHAVTPDAPSSAPAPRLRHLRRVPAPATTEAPVSGDAGQRLDRVAATPRAPPVRRRQVSEHGQRADYQAPIEYRNNARVADSGRDLQHVRHRGYAHGCRCGDQSSARLQRSPGSRQGPGRLHEGDAETAGNPNQSFPEPNSSPAPEPTKEEDCRCSIGDKVANGDQAREEQKESEEQRFYEEVCGCSLPEGSGGGRPLEDEVPKAEE